MVQCTPFCTFFFPVHFQCSGYSLQHPTPTSYNLTTDSNVLVHRYEGAHNIGQSINKKIALSLDHSPRIDAGMTKNQEAVESQKNKEKQGQQQVGGRADEQREKASQEETEHGSAIGPLTDAAMALQHAISRLSDTGGGPNGLFSVAGSERTNVVAGSTLSVNQDAITAVARMLQEGEFACNFQDKPEPVSCLNTRSSRCFDSLHRHL